MSWLSKQLKSAKKAVTHPGDWAKNALKTGVQLAPLALAASNPLTAGIVSKVRALPGVKNIPILGSGGGIKLPGRDVIDAANRAGMDVSDQVAGAQGSGPWADILGGIKAGRKAIGAPAITPRNVAGAAGRGGGGNVLERAGRYLMDNKLEAAMIGLAGAQAAAAVDASRRSSRLQDSALNRSRESWTNRAPLRERAQATLLSPPRTDLSDVFSWQSRPRAIMPPAGGARPVPMPVAPPVITPAPRSKQDVAARFGGVRLPKKKRAALVV